MNNLWILIQVILCRFKNKIFILSSQRPEILFTIVIAAFAALAAAIYIPSLMDYSAPITIEMFPDSSYIFLSAAIIPILVWILRQSKNNDEEFTIFNYIFQDYFKYLKALGFYVISSTLSFIILYIVLSIYDNISILSSILYWHILGLLIFVCSYGLSLITNNLLVQKNILKDDRLLGFKLLLISFILLFLALPIHKSLGVFWLTSSTNIFILIPVLVLGIMIYIYVVAQDIKSGQITAGIKNDFSRFKKTNNHIYNFLILIDIRKNITFYVLSIIFLVILSILTEQYFVMLDLFKVIVLIGNIGFVFQKISSVSTPLKMMRASNFRFSLWLLHAYFLLAMISLMIFYMVITLFSPFDLLFILESSDLFIFSITMYISLYLSIVVGYLLGEYLGPLAQSISSGIILIIGYWILPDVLFRLFSLNNLFLEFLISAAALAILFLVKWVTIHEYKNSEII